MERRGLTENRKLNKNPRNKQECKAAGSHVVQRSDWIERNTLRGKQDLDEDKAGGLKGDSRELKSHPPNIEPGLTIGSDGDPKGDRKHVRHGRRPEGLLLEEYPNRVNSDGHEGFEHLDKRNREVDVCGVGEPQRERVKSADGENRGDIELACHRRRCRRLHKAEDADEYDGEGGAKGHMDHRQRDRKRPIVHLPIEDVLVVDDDGETQENPDRHVEVREHDLLHHPIGHPRRWSAAAAHGVEKP